MKQIFCFCWFIFTALSSWASEIKVLAFSGSAREGSYNQMLAAQAADIARQMGAKVTLISLKDYPMPFYDADMEAKKGMPPKAKAFRNLMLEHDAIIIASPEYNGSLTALLKNAIDWASRSEEGSFSLDAFQGKRFAIMSASPGRGGGARGLVHLRAILEGVGGTVVPDQVTIPQAHEYFAKKPLPENPQLKQEVTELLSQ